MYFLLNLFKEIKYLNRQMKKLLNDLYVGVKINLACVNRIIFIIITSRWYRIILSTQTHTAMNIYLFGL